MFSLSGSAHDPLGQQLEDQEFDQVARERAEREAKRAERTFEHATAMDALQQELEALMERSRAAGPAPTFALPDYGVRTKW